MRCTTGKDKKHAQSSSRSDHESVPRLGLADLEALQLGFLAGSPGQRSIVQVVAREQLRDQVPEVVHKVLEWELGGKACAGDAHSLQHTSAPQLL